MRIRSTLVHIIIVSAASMLLGSCAKKENRAVEESNVSSAQDTQPLADHGQAMTPARTAPHATPPRQADAIGLQKQKDEVRAAFVSLQQICKAGDIDGYVAFWDDETKKEIDGRDMDVAERRQRRRERLAKQPQVLKEIADAKIESIAVDTSQAQKIETQQGVTIEGTMMLVCTDGARAFLFHETTDGWKLFTRASREYFREQ